VILVTFGNYSQDGCECVKYGPFIEFLVDIVITNNLTNLCVVFIYGGVSGKYRRSVTDVA